MSLVRRAIVACAFGTIALAAPLALADSGSSTTTTDEQDEGLVAGGGACNGGGAAEGLIVSMASVAGLVARRVRKS